MHPLKITNTERMPDLMAACEAQMRRSTCRPTSKRLHELICYHLDSGGSRTRAKLALWAGLKLGLSDSTCVGIAAACELIHNASLLHDDIQDQDTHRRGREAAWLHYDINTAMCGGTLMLSAAYESLAHTHTDVGQLIAHVHLRTADLIYGQVNDVNHQRETLGLADYVHIASQKSGSLLALPLELVMLAAQQPLAVGVARQAGESFAVAYQIADDLTDLDNDLAQGALNVVEVIMSGGVTREHALQQAVVHAQRALEQSSHAALQLPLNSGQEVVDMCTQLASTLVVFNSSYCEQL